MGLFLSLLYLAKKIAGGKRQLKILGTIETD